MANRERKLLIAFRQALLACVAAIEEYLEITPTTASLRKLHKQQRLEKKEANSA